MAESYESLQETSEQKFSHLENYEVNKDDLEVISEGMDVLSESGLFEQGVLDEIRVVTYDSKNLYIFTKGEHVSVDHFKVEEVPLSNKTGFRLYKIAYRGFIGKKKDDYQGAQAWLLCDEIETTAINAKKFPNENILYEPDISQPKEILDVVSMAPKRPFEILNAGRYDYLTDVMFHEAGHIEQRRLEDWHEGEESVSTFPSQEQEKEFKKIVERSTLFSKGIIDTIINHIDKGAVSEMYPMLIDREASRRYRLQKLESEDWEFNESLSKITTSEADSSIEELIRSRHTVGRLLVRILENQFLEFAVRKEFVRKILSRSAQTPI